MPKAGKLSFGVVCKLGKLDGVYGNEYLLSSRLEGDSSSSSSSGSRQGNVKFLVREMVASPDQTRTGIRWFLSGVS